MTIFHSEEPEEMTVGTKKNFHITDAAVRRIEQIVDEAEKKLGWGALIPTIALALAKNNASLSEDTIVIGLHKKSEVPKEELSRQGDFEFLIALGHEESQLFDGMILDAPFDGLLRLTKDLSR